MRRCCVGSPVVVVATQHHALMHGIIIHISTMLPRYSFCNAVHWPATKELCDPAMPLGVANMFIDRLPRLRACIFCMAGGQVDSAPLLIDECIARFHVCMKMVLCVALFSAGYVIRAAALATWHRFGCRSM